MSWITSAWTPERTFGILERMEPESLIALPRPAQTPEPRVLARSTEVSYDLDFKRFERYCADRHKPALPAAPRTISDYLKYLAQTRRFSTARRALFAIEYRHEQEGYEPLPTRSPLVTKTYKGLAGHGTKPPLRKRAIVSEGVRAIIARMYTDPFANAGQRRRALRDHAFILLLYTGCLTREEARRLQVENIEPVVEGLRPWVAASDDKELRPVVVLHEPREEVDPIRALATWFSETGIADGYVFRAVYDDGASGEKPLARRYLTRLVKGRAKDAGIDPALVSPQSFRSGFVVQVAASGGTLKQILQQTGHAEPRHLDDLVDAGRQWANHPQKLLLL